MLLTLIWLFCLIWFIFCRLQVEMKGFILHLHRTSMKTICSCLSLLGRCSGKLFMRYICAFRGNALTCYSLRWAPSVLGNLQCMCNCNLCIQRALLWTSLLPPSSWVKSWVTTTALSTAPSTSCPRWTLNFTRTSLRSRSAPITLGQFWFAVIFPHLHLHLTSLICFFSALWWRCRGSRTDVILWWGCYGTGKTGRCGRCDAV